MDSFSDALYARPSFIEGAARIMDLADSMTVYNSSPSAEEADRVSIAMDWAAVGHDIKVAAKDGDPLADNHSDKTGLPSCL